MDKERVGTHFSYGWGVINLMVIFGVVCFVWYLLLHPNGVMKLYTPMYGFSLVAIFLCSIVLIGNIGECYPFAVSTPELSVRLGKGVILTITAVILTLILTYWVFWGLIGKFGVAYFSPRSIVASGGTGAEPFNARENASTAIVYFAVAFLWWALAWTSGFRQWPWMGSGRRLVAGSRFFVIIFFTIITYVLLFHPHVCFLFDPPQNKAGVEPWWASFAGTGSAFFSLGLILCSLAWVTISDLLWEGYPWRLAGHDQRGSLLRGIATIVGSFLLGLVTFVILWMGPFQGGHYADAPDFRCIHTGEIAGFVILAAFILKTYFNNFPNRGRLVPRACVRTAIAFGGGAVLYLFYHLPASTLLLGKIPGTAESGATSLVWTMLFLSVVMIQAEFFEGWPMATPVTENEA
jgi:amino acid transporter, AAT family